MRHALHIRVTDFSGRIAAVIMERENCIRSFYMTRMALRDLYNGEVTWI